uniref:Zinc finger and BTB domain containing 22a n=1 Tax=Anabas testudineus TaxID=64144 RepID=A0A7N6B7X5_ANATE
IDWDANIELVCFPGARAAVLDNLNRQREEGRLCDLSIQVQGQVFRAHRCVLAASSPYFHDQVLLKNVTTVSLPSVMDPVAFESVLSSAYTGQLSIVHDDIVNYVTVASFLQMWHIVDKCTEILKRPRPPAEVTTGEATVAHPGTASRQQSPSSTDSFHHVSSKNEEPGQASGKISVEEIKEKVQRDLVGSDQSSDVPSVHACQTVSLAGAPYTGKVHFCHCGKAYTLKSMRDRHVKMQHLNLRPFGCPVCTKSFKMKHHLTKHLKTHGGLRPYECSLCGKKVIWRDSFLRHQARCERLEQSCFIQVILYHFCSITLA